MGFSASVSNSISAVQIIIAFVLLACGGTLGNDSDSDSNASPSSADGVLPVQDVLDTIMVGKGYDRRFRPNHDKAAVDVYVEASVISMPTIDSAKQEMTLNVFLKQSWTDARLDFQDQGRKKSIKLDSSHWSRIWMPDTFVVNELSSSRHDVTLPNFYVRLSPNGSVFHSARYTIVTSCPMHFQYFPFDEQTCFVNFESYCCTGEDIRYVWAKGSDSLKFVEEMSHMGFKVIGHRVTRSFASFSVAGRSRLSIEIRFRRSPGRYLVQFFYPCVFLAVLSLLALFVADPRMSVLINVLTMGFTILFLAQSSGALEGPFVSYATALDTFYSITYTFLFISLSISVLALNLNKNDYGPELIKLSEFGRSSNGRTRFENPLEDEISIYPDISATGTGTGSSTQHHQQRNRNQQQIPSTKAVLLCGGVFFRMVPCLKFFSVIIYLLANLIFWSTIPFAQQTQKDVLLADDWNLM